MVAVRRQGLAEHLLAFGVERRRLIAADEHRVIRAEHHVEQLAHLIVRGRELVIEQVRELVFLETGLELLEGLRADAFDAQELVFGVADEIAHRIDARFAELIGPALGDSQVIVQIQTRILVGELLAVTAIAVGAEIVRVGAVAFVEGPVLRLRQQVFDLAQLGRRALGKIFAFDRRRRRAVIGQADLMVAGQARAGRNRLADDDVLLEALKAVDLAFDGGIGQDLGGFLERCGRQEGIGGQGRLGDAEQQRLADRRLLALRDELVGDCLLYTSDAADEL